MTNYVHFNKNWKLANKKLQIIVLSDQFAKFGTFHGMCFIFFPDQRMLKNDLFPQNFIFRLIFAKRLHSRQPGGISKIQYILKEYITIFNDTHLDTFCYDTVSSSDWVVGKE